MEKILETKSLSVSFGEHDVIKDVSLEIERGKLTSIIGPNGAGKTTLFNLLSGQITPTNGEIYFKKDNITKLSVPLRARRGIGRSFQLTNIFPELTVLENIRLAIQSSSKDYYSILPRLSFMSRQQEEAKFAMERCMLSGKEDVLAQDLAHGEKRKLELAMLLALKTELLLLDEPTAGISIEEIPAILQVIENIKKEGMYTIVLIEHKMEMVMHLSDTLVVLFNGELLASGNPKEIIKDQRVQTAYLGGLHRESIKTG
ncbi:ABC transporter ATP-binding protein [Cytobacillus pseudoceanisediminis]|uniref:ABC transporter ATP-binding protein n=1 Tax=Cytobacillus pseudoceanisediminis TaxID=3051614 RepID=A0ABZ2ZEI9_9BACI|nr:ABC transporter ATP-binding protein [Cytobacillus sp. Bac17]EFV76739.1 branched-chain amino acid ABC transporter [Bacillus sp. 2_A_57_CT2]